MRDAERRIVLVADDDEDVRHYLKTLMEREGHEVLTAANGTDAIALVERVQPDLVLLDGMMPGADGYTVCRQVKKNDLLGRMKIVLYTASAKPGLERIAREAGADVFLQKPFDARRLADILRGLFQDQDRESARLVSLGR